MGELETAVTKSWASIFIDTTNTEQLVYEDFIAIYHVMNGLEIPEEPIKNVAEFLVENLKKKIGLPDCTLRNADYQLKILVYLSCSSDCPTQASTIERVTRLEKEEQILIYEIIQDIDGLVASHANKQETGKSSETCITTTPGKKQENAIKTLEESFSNSTETEESWKEKYNALRLQHISDEAEIQELNDRLEQCFEEISRVKTESTHLQSQIVEKNSMKLQLDDFKLANADLVDQLEKSQKNVSKLKLKVKDVAELESALSDNQNEVAKLTEDLAQAQRLNSQNQLARQEQRKEYQEKCRIQVENKTYLALIAQLRAENETLKQDRRQSLLPMNRLNNIPDSSFEALPSLADELMTAEAPPTNEELETLKTENTELKTNVENLQIGERVMQEQIESQVEEITKLTNKYHELEMSHFRKAEQLESWKAMYQKFKYESEAKYDEIVHEHRQELSKIKSDLHDSLFVAKKDLLDKESAIKKLQRQLEMQKTRAVAARPEYSSPSPNTPVIIKRYRTPKTPSNIPRLLTPKRNYVRDFDNSRMDEMSKRNQSVLPHLR
ncbi:outer dense fiber protein 2-like isoform X2 [Bolinopsis microptera]